MATLLAKNAAVLVTMDDERREISHGGLLIRDHVIEQVGPTSDLPQEADRVLDLSGHIVLPGLVNTHHHLYQSLTRALACEADLFTWLITLYPIWARLTDEAIYVSTLTGLAELALSGCTTSSDHLYIFPNDCTLDSQIRAASEIGLRFHAARGSMTLGESEGGLPPDSVTEQDADVLRDSQRLIEQYHDSNRHAMLRIVLAPCSPFNVTPALMRASAEMARAYGVRLHTHLAETIEEEAYCLATFGMRPAAYIESLGWLGEDVWHAHCVQLNADEISAFAHSGTGVAHCPSSNMRLGSGIAPLKAFRQRGVAVGLGVDGSASNDSGDLLAEARQAMLLQRVAPTRKVAEASGLAGDPAALTARQALELATRGGAAVLGRDDIGSLAPGMSADFIAIHIDRLAYAGALHDPVAALLFCQPQSVDYNFVHGRAIVEERHLKTIELEQVVRRHNEIAAALLRGET